MHPIWHFCILNGYSAYWICLISLFGGSGIVYQSSCTRHVCSRQSVSFFCLCSLELWGYKRVEEIIWVKTNQLQRIIRTGRTGHWLNHSKEHCLVGVKGNPEVNRNIDTDVIVAEVRETSRKPDEVSHWLTYPPLPMHTFNPLESTIYIHLIPPPFIIMIEVNIYFFRLLWPYILARKIVEVLGNMNLKIFQ